jgi:cytoskeleton protein RodZ
LVAALQRRGDRLEVSGPAPLHVVIGAVDAVSTIQFQDAPVDLGQFPVTNNRAEFTLSP